MHVCSAGGRGQEEAASQNDETGREGGPHTEKESGPEGMSQSLEFYNWEDIPSTEGTERRREDTLSARRKPGQGTMEGE